MKIIKSITIFMFIMIGIFVGQASLQAQQKTAAKKIIQGPLKEYPLQVWRKESPEKKRDKIAKALPQLSTSEISLAVEGYDQKVFALPKKSEASCKPKVYGISTATGFTLYNKSDKPIWIGLINGSRVMLTNTALAAKDGGRAASFISTNKPSTVLIWDVDPRQVSYTGTNNKPVISPAPKHTYHIKQSKTVYLTWDGAKLAPSEGAAGCTNMTSTGFSLKNNVLQSDIVKK